MKKEEEEQYSTFDVLKILGIKRERLRQWVDQGFVVPTSRADGVGTKAIFSLLDIYKIAVFKTLVDAKFNRRKAAVLVKTNPTLNAYYKIENLACIMVTEMKGKTEWESFFESEPWNIEKTIKQNKGWTVGILINFRELKMRIEEGLGR